MDNIVLLSLIIKYIVNNVYHMEADIHHPSGPAQIPVRNADGSFTVLMYEWTPDYDLMNEQLHTSRRLRYGRAR